MDLTQKFSTDAENFYTSFILYENFFEDNKTKAI